VVAPSAVVRAGLEALLSHGDDLVVVGTAATRDALGDLGAADVDVLVIDDDARAHLAELRADATDDDAPGGPAIVLLVEEPTPAIARDAIAAGVRALLPRDAAESALHAAVRAAAAGLIVLTPEAARPDPARRPGRPPGDAPRAGLLTPRELEVLQALAEGLANKQVAARLGISEHTIKTHVAAVFDKLGVTTRAEAVARGVQLGVLML
ncbi:MAG: response regulator transcription factor, partial [Gemmatimonadetes bacterium]|nr:response regulator transcription factor [Gemmatimonadota bacterium]